MHKSAFAIAMMVTTVSFPSLAADGPDDPDAPVGPDWNYVEASYIETDVDNLGKELKGWEVEGSLKFSEWAFLRGSYSQQEEEFDQDVDLDQFSVGVGGIWTLSDTTHLYGEVSYEHWSLDSNDVNLDGDESGSRLGIGARSVVWRGLELNAELGYIDIDDFANGEAYFEVGGLYTFWKGLGLSASYEEIDDLDTWRVGLRWSFR